MCVCFPLSLHSVVREEDGWTARAAYQIFCGPKVCSTQSQQPLPHWKGHHKAFHVAIALGKDVIHELQLSDRGDSNKFFLPSEYYFPKHCAKAFSKWSSFRAGKCGIVSNPKRLRQQPVSAHHHVLSDLQLIHRIYRNIGIFSPHIMIIMKIVCITCI